MDAVLKLFQLMVVWFLLLPAGCGIREQTTKTAPDKTTSPKPTETVPEDVSSPQVLIPKGSASPRLPEIKQVNVIRDGWQVLLPKFVNGKETKEFEMSDRKGRQVKVVQKHYAASGNTLFELKNKGIVSGGFSGTLRISGATEYSVNDIPFVYTIRVEHVRIKDDGSIEGPCCGPIVTMIHDSDGDGKFESLKDGVGLVPDWVLRKAQPKNSPRR